MKKWQILNKVKSQKSKVKTDEIIKLLLQNRGLKTKKEIEEFLHPPDPSFLDPKTLGININELSKAIKRIIKAVKNKESVIVYGDYDADGVCGTAILWETLNKSGARVMPYIPHRVEEGYGLSQKGIDFIKKEYGVNLIITVDHGIGSLEKIDYCHQSGIDVIITDHHVAPEKLPEALAIVHTTNLCGAGVAWFLAKEIDKNCHPEFISGSKILNQVQHDGNYLDLVAIATIADMVPLTGANRILVKQGLEELRKTKRTGLKALIKEGKINQEKINIYDISHILAPRLNATGRLAHALDALRLLCTKDENKAKSLAHELEMTNRQRQKLTEDTILHAEDLLIKQMGVTPETARLIFISHRSYNQGIIGLVAGRLVEKFYRPSIVIARSEEFSKGSARSVNGFNIIETIRKAQDLLVDTGGHPMAAGFTIETKNLEALKERLTEIANQELDEDKLTRVLKIDCELNLQDLNFELYEKLENFKPYGLGNPEPVFATRSVTIREAKAVGSGGQHLKLLLESPAQRKTRNPAKTFSAVAFGLGELLTKLSPEKLVEVAYTLTLNEWNGAKKLELKIKDLKIED